MGSQYLNVEGLPQSHNVTLLSSATVLSSTPVSSHGGSSSRYVPGVGTSKSVGGQSPHVASGSVNFRRSQSRYNVKIVKAKLQRDENQKPVFRILEQEFIGVTESSANVPYIKNVIQQKFGSNFIVVTSDCTVRNTWLC